MAFIAFMASGQRHHIKMVLIGQGNDMQKLLTAYLSRASKDTLWCYVINVLMYCDSGDMLITCRFHFIMWSCAGVLERSNFCA